MTQTRLRFVATGLVCVVAYIAIGVLVRNNGFLLDQGIADALHGVWRRQLGQVPGVLTDILGPLLPIAFGAVLVLWMLWCLWCRERARAAFLLRVALVLLLCRLTSVVSKPLFERARPLQYPDFSYPSGHVVSVASVGLAATVLCLWLAPKLLRWIVPLAVVATALAAACRIVLGVHWFTDTVGSVLIVFGIGLPACAALGLLPACRERVSRTEPNA